MRICDTLPTLRQIGQIGVVTVAISPKTDQKTAETRKMIRASAVWVRCERQRGLISVDHRSRPSQVPTTRWRLLPARLYGRSDAGTMSLWLRHANASLPLEWQ